MRTHHPTGLLRYLALSLCVFAIAGSTSVFSQGSVSGEFRKWHTISISFSGPNLTEQSTDNPFLDYRLNVTFTAPSGKTFIVPGFYAADGNAAESSASSGNKWMVRFSPAESGIWNYNASFREGNEVAVSLAPNAGSPSWFDGASGSFNIASSNKVEPDNRANGRLSYVGKRYLQFEGSGKYFLKAGTDSPENLLAFADFDNTPNIKSWGPHVQDWMPGDPVWKGDMGKGIIGAINYLAGKGMNAFSFNPMTIEDRQVNKYNTKDVWPFSSSDLNLLQGTSAQSIDSRLRYDVSKLEQWEILFKHADNKGMFLHFKTQDRTNLRLFDYNGNLTTQRKLYYRELIARFGHHLALNWNLGEEFHIYDGAIIDSYADYIKAVDPYDHPVVIHSYPRSQDRLYPLILGPDFEMDGASMQIFTDEAHEEIKYWLVQAENSGKPWVIGYDEQAHWDIGVAADADFNGNKGTIADNRENIRDRALWSTLMVGATGVEYYFGGKTGENDRTAQDWRSRETKWEDAKIAIDFFHNYVQFWEMDTSDELTSSSTDYCFAKAGETYVIYLPDGGTTNLDLSAVGGSYSVKWFNPRNGGALLNSNVTELQGGSNTSIGNPPADSSLDWAVLIEKIDDPDPTVAVTSVTVSPETASLEEGQSLNLIATLQPADATDQSVSWSSDKPGVATVDQNGTVNAISNGSATISVQTADGGFTATSFITVTASVINVTGLTIVPASVTLGEGEETNLNAQITPADATNQAVVWSSNAPAVALVDQNGKVTAIAEGTATISAETVDGGFVATSLVTVNGTPPPPPALSITEFTLINAGSDTDMFTLLDGMVIDLGDVQGKSLNIRANTDPSVVGSVSLSLIGPVNRNTTENVAPYALFGDNAGNYSGKTLPPGNYILTGTPYSESKKGGTAGPELVINFSIEDLGNNQNLPPVADLQASPTTGTIPLVVNFQGNGSTDDNGISSFFWDFGDGNTSTQTNPSHTYTLAGTYTTTLTVTDDEGLTDTASVSINATDPAPPPPPGSESLTMLNAASDADLFVLSNGMEIDFESIKNTPLNIRADFHGLNVGSVGFVLSGQLSRNLTENVAPYALFGDNAGDYRGRKFPKGIYNLSVTAYSGSNRNGSQLATIGVQFTITDLGANKQQAISVKASSDVLKETKSQYAGSKMRIYPVPASNTLNAAVADPTIAMAMMHIYTLNGTLAKSYMKPAHLLSGAGRYEIDIADLPGGVYILKAYMDSYYAFQYRFIVSD